MVTIEGHLILGPQELDHSGVVGYRLMLVDLFEVGQTQLLLVVGEQGFYHHLELLRPWNGRNVESGIQLAFAAFFQQLQGSPLLDALLAGAEVYQAFLIEAAVTTGNALATACMRLAR